MPYTYPGDYRAEREQIALERNRAMIDTRIELRREQSPGQPFGQVHIVLHVPKTQRTEVGICGIDTSTMMKRTGPFEGWHQIACEGCAKGLEI